MKRILVIDDESLVRAMLRMTLEDAGYQVEEAGDGEAGIRAFIEKPADLVITDIVMPEKEGIETILELKKVYPGVKIIAISGGGRVKPENYLSIAKSLGVEHTFTKPVDKEKLMSAVADLCGR